MYFNNYITEDFKKMFQPLHFLQCVYCLPKFRIKHNFLIAHSFISKSIYTAFVSLMLSLTIIRAVLKSEISPVFQYLGVYEIVASVIGFYISWKVNIYKSKDNVDFLINLQRNMNFDCNNERIIKRITFINWVVVIMTLFSHLITFVSVYFVSFDDVIGLICVFGYKSFDIHIIYVSHMILMIRLSFESLIYQINTSQFGRKSSIWRRHRNLQWEDVFKKYLQLLESFEVNRKTFEGLVRYYFVY